MNSPLCVFFNQTLSYLGGRVLTSQLKIDYIVYLHPMTPSSLNFSIYLSFAVFQTRTNKKAIQFNLEFLLLLLVWCHASTPIAHSSLIEPLNDMNERERTAKKKTLYKHY
jgi:hypothetical protein